MCLEVSLTITQRLLLTYTYTILRFFLLFCLRSLIKIPKPLIYNIFIDAHDLVRV